MGSTDIKSTLQEMNEYEFEYLVADLWELDGWDTTVSQASNDDGVDVTATKDTPFDRKELIQAKRYSDGTSVGGPDIQQYASLRHQKSGVDSVAVVTTSSFTASAERMAKKLNVKLVDGDGLATWMVESDEDILDEYIDRSSSSSSPTTVSVKPVEFTQADLARKNEHHPANLSTDSLVKQNLIREVYTGEFQTFEKVEEINCICMYFKYQNKVKPYYKFGFGEHNCTRIDERATEKARSIAEQERGVKFSSEESWDYGTFVTLTTKNCKNKSYRGYYDVWITTRILYELYNVKIEDIKRVEHDGQNGTVVWNEIPDYVEVEDDTRGKTLELSAEKRAERLAKRNHKSVTKSRLMGKSEDPHLDYLHDKPLLRYLSTDEEPWYFFCNGTKGVKIGDERISSGWTEKYRNSLLVTDRGVHFFVGRTDGDFHEFLDRGSIQNVEARTGIMKNRLIFETKK